MGRVLISIFFCVDKEHNFDIILLWGFEKTTFFKDKITGDYSLSSIIISNQNGLEAVEYIGFLHRTRSKKKKRMNPLIHRAIKF